MCAQQPIISNHGTNCNQSTKHSKWKNKKKTQRIVDEWKKHKHIPKSEQRMKGNHEEEY